MTEPTWERWTWCQRVRDPRFPAFVALVTASAVLASAVFGFNHGSAVFSIGVAVGVALFALPSWRDTKHGPGAGAVVLGGGAVLVLAIAWLVR